MNPFELHGPAYLTFYTGALVFGAMSGLVMRHLFLSVDRSPWVPSESVARELDPYEVAYLVGGEDRAFLTTCATLARHRVVEIDRSEKHIRLLAAADAQRMSEAEQSLVTQLKSGPKSAESAKDSMKWVFAHIRKRLTEKGLVPDEVTIAKATIIPCLWFMAITAIFSIPKIGMAIAENRPHTYLVMMAFFAAMAGFMFLKRPAVTNKGRLAALSLRESSSALHLTAMTNPSSLGLRDIALAYGLFGVMANYGDPFADAMYVLKPKPASGSGGCSSSGCGSSCGSSCGGGCGGGCGG
ncbi:MAG: TIGR04222 domain-containing membrane protein [Cyanobacteria bacterium SZAS TMP-1]|nr:TIGR04222 domain-containing membrane protein [Cyanobacteria bacterium SZAS TMP-1]